MIATSVRGAEPLAVSVSLGYAESLRALSHELKLDVIPPLVAYSDDNIRARNRMAALALREFPKATHVLWWDDDMWPEDRHIVREMMASGEDVISAPYTNKRQPLRWTHQALDPSPPPVDNKQEVRSVGFGFTMTTMRALRTMSADKRTLSYRDHPHEHVIPNLFGMLYDHPLAGGTGPVEECALLSEDRSFCKRWRDMGGRVVLKMDVGAIFHAGAHAWSAREIPGALT